VQLHHGAGQQRHQRTVPPNNRLRTKLRASETPVKMSDGDVRRSLDQRHQPRLTHAASLSPNRSSRFVTVDTCQRPPRRVSMPQGFSLAAIA
jgi:hypothetical protein